jgi:hypothetical protein
LDEGLAKDPLAWAGEKIDQAVHSAESTVDTWRQDIVAFGERHGGVAGRSKTLPFNDQLGDFGGAVYDDLLRQLSDELENPAPKGSPAPSRCGRPISTMALNPKMVKLKTSDKPLSQIKNNQDYRIDFYKSSSNPFPNLPSFVDAFPNSNIVAPVADIIVGGMEAGVSTAAGVAAGVSFLAGPEFWWITVPAAPTSIEAGVDAYSRISGAMERLGENSP